MTHLLDVLLHGPIITKYQACCLCSCEASDSERSGSSHTSPSTPLPLLLSDQLPFLALVPWPHCLAKPPSCTLSFSPYDAHSHLSHHVGLTVSLRRVCEGMNWAAFLGFFHQGSSRPWHTKGSQEKWLLSVWMSEPAKAKSMEVVCLGAES